MDFEMTAEPKGPSEVEKNIRSAKGQKAFRLEQKKSDISLLKVRIEGSGKKKFEDDKEKSQGKDEPSKKYKDIKKYRSRLDKIR